MAVNDAIRRTHTERPRQGQPTSKCSAGAGYEGAATPRTALGPRSVLSPPGRVG
jgi:hypothetical protein